MYRVAVAIHALIEYSPTGPWPQPTQARTGGTIGDVTCTLHTGAAVWRAHTYIKSVRTHTGARAHATHTPFVRLADIRQSVCNYREMCIAGKWTGIGRVSGGRASQRRWVMKCVDSGEEVGCWGRCTAVCRRVCLGMAVCVG